MAIIYLRSTNGTADADDGSTWALAKTTLAAALTAANAGGTVYVSQAHAETQATAMTLTSPGTADSPCKIICVSDTAEPPTTLATTATVTTTGIASLNFGSGFAKYYGITFSGTTSNAIAAISFSNTSLGWGYEFDSCLLTIGSGNVASTGRIILSINANQGRSIKFINTKFGFRHISQGIETNNSRIEWINTPSAIVNTVPTTLFLPSVSPGCIVRCSGIDLSAIGNGKYLVNASTIATTTVSFSNCLLGDAVSVISGTIISQSGTQVYLDNCDSDDPSSGPRSEAYTYQGSVKTDTAKYRTGGASDGTSYSLMMTSNTTGVSFISPLATRPIPKVIDTVGSEITVTAHIAMEEGATPLTESQCWMEVEYMGTSGSTITSFLTDNNSTVISESSTAQTTSTETWTGFTGTPVKQQLAVTFTPQEKGFCMVRIYLARVSAETTAPPVYVCPKLVVS